MHSMRSIRGEFTVFKNESTGLMSSMPMWMHHGMTKWAASGFLLGVTPVTVTVDFVIYLPLGDIIVERIEPLGYITSKLGQSFASRATGTLLRVKLKTVVRRSDRLRVCN